MFCSNLSKVEVNSLISDTEKVHKLIMKISHAVWQMPWRFYLQSSFFYSLGNLLALSWKDNFLRRRRKINQLKHSFINVSVHSS